jgi:hypothetical protein
MIMYALVLDCLDYFQFLFYLGMIDLTANSFYEYR